jgi:hypothetical protein
MNLKVEKENNKQINKKKEINEHEHVAVSCKGWKPCTLHTYQQPISAYQGNTVVLWFFALSIYLLDGFTVYIRNINECIGIRIIIIIIMVILNLSQFNEARLKKNEKVVWPQIVKHPSLIASQLYLIKC